MDIYIGSDYRGFERKKELLKALAGIEDYNIIDIGAYSYHEGDDFNDPAITVAKNVREDRDSKGILIWHKRLGCQQLFCSSELLR